VPRSLRRRRERRDAAFSLVVLLLYPIVVDGKYYRIVNVIDIAISRSFRVTEGLSAGALARSGVRPGEEGADSSATTDPGTDGGREDRGRRLPRRAVPPLSCVRGQAVDESARGPGRRGGRDSRAARGARHRVLRDAAEPMGDFRRRDLAPPARGHR